VGKSASTTKRRVRNRGPRRGTRNGKGTGTFMKKELSFNLAPKSQMNVIPGDWQGDCARVNLRFTDAVFVLPAVSGVYTTQSYGINTPRVPEQSGMSGVSQGWAVWSGQYARYLPLGARIKWQILNNAQFTAAETVVDFVSTKVAFAPISSDMANLTNVEDHAVQKYAKWWQMPDQAPLTAAAATTSPSTDPRNCWSGSANFQMDKLAGVATMQNATFAAVVASDPSLKWFFTFGWQDTNANAHGKAGLIFNVEITYDILFYSRVSKANALERPITKRRIREVKEEESKKPILAVAIEPVTPESEYHLVKVATKSTRAQSSKS